MAKKRIFRLALAAGKTRRITSFKLVEGTSIQQVLSKPKSKFVGKGVKIVGVATTRFRGRLKKRMLLPRSKRFGKGFN